MHLAFLPVIGIDWFAPRCMLFEEHPTPNNRTAGYRIREGQSAGHSKQDITDIETANQWIREVYLPAHNPDVRH
jgi:hypothetical protein